MRKVVAIFVLAVVLPCCSPSSRLEHIVPGWSNPPPQHSETTQYEAKKRPEARSKADTKIPREQKTPEPGAQSALEE